jgi:N12 class adenine-specific DNA methylase
VIREGSYFIDKNTALMQMVDGAPVTITVRKGRTAEGVPDKHAHIVRKLIPIRDAVREVLKAQEFDRPWKPAQVKLRIAWSNFVRAFGPINTTVVSTSEDSETGEVRETHRRPNLQPFLDDPDCWLVASIEDYDLETDTARPGPIFTERVIAPPSAPIIASAADALAVVLNERGYVDIDHIAELLHVDTEIVIADLGDSIFRDPESGAWQTDDAYLSGQVRDKLKAAEAAAALDPAFERNVRALVAVQPADLGPSDITARLGAPWIPAADVVAFVKETMGADIRIHHMPELASWTVEARQLGYMAAGTSEWGTERRHAGELIADALNSRVPQIFDHLKDGDSEKRVLNVVDTEAAKEKLTAFRFISVPSAFEQQMIQDELELYETLLTKVESGDRVSRKRLERLKEGLKERLESLATRKDDLLTISEIGVDQIIVDEAQEFRKLSFATNMSTLKGIDPNGSQRAWDLHVKSRFVETKNPGRALVLASGTPVTNTLGRCSRCSAISAMRRSPSGACTSSTPGPRPSAT